MQPEILRQLVTGDYEFRDALIMGYTSRAVIKQVYPALMPSASDQVHGRLYHGLHESDLLKLDLFEGDMYRRTEVTVLANNVELPAFTYLCKPAYYILFLKKIGS